MTQTMTETSVFDRIARGEFDDQLDELFQALKDRRKFAGQQKAAQNKASMNPGDKVRVTAGISPQYLIGVTGTVSPKPARRAGDVQVDIDEAYRARTRKFGTSVGVPANCLAKIEPK